MIFRITGTIEVTDQIEADDIASAARQFIAIRGVEPDRVDGNGWGGFCTRCGKPCLSKPGYSWDSDNKRQWCMNCARFLRRGEIDEALAARTEAEEGKP